MPTTHQDPVYTLARLVQTHLPQLPRPTARLLACFAYAACLARAASVLRCAALMAAHERAPLGRLRQRLREFYLDGAHKRGRARRSLDVHGCFGALLQWALTQTAPTGQIVLALDPSLCRERLCCLCVSLVTQDVSIPVAWSIVPANEKGAWLRPYLALVEQLGRILSTGTEAHRRVYVLCDRGLFCKALFKAVTELGWHPLFRVPANGYWSTRHRTMHLRDVVSAPGHSYAARGQLHKAHPLSCTLVGVWQEGYKEPWLIATDERPEQAQAHLYGLRAKIERVFRTVKSDVFDWEKSRITLPERAERMWLVYAVGMLMMAYHAQSAGSSKAGLRAAGLCRSDVWERLGRRMSQMRIGQMMLWRAVFDAGVYLAPTTPAVNSS